MIAYESEGVRRKYLLFSIHDYLLTIKSTIVEAERIFSLAGYIYSCVKSRLSNVRFAVIVLFLRCHVQLLF